VRQAGRRGLEAPPAQDPARLRGARLAEHDTAPEPARVADAFLSELDEQEVAGRPVVLEDAYRPVQLGRHHVHVSVPVEVAEGGAPVHVGLGQPRSRVLRGHPLEAGAPALEEERRLAPGRVHGLERGVASG
jgi:hypothetical protein